MPAPLPRQQPLLAGPTEQSGQAAGEVDDRSAAQAKTKAQLLSPGPPNPLVCIIKGVDDDRSIAPVRADQGNAPVVQGDEALPERQLEQQERPVIGEGVEVVPEHAVRVRDA